MENIDALQINFSPDQLGLLNICLSFLVFGIALDIKVADFQYLLQHPKTTLVGLISQLILLPILTLALIYVFSPPASMALGMLLVGVCPGGSTSNFMVHIAKANTALSITLTSVVTLGAIVLTPLSFTWLSQFIPGTESLQQNIHVSPQQMFLTIIQLVVVPLFLGMGLNHRFPRLTDRLRRPIRILSILIFLGFVVIAAAKNYDNIVQYLHRVFLIVLTYNGLALLMGYAWSQLNKLPQADARAIAIETGIQNSGLALILIFNFFDGLGGMALVAAWWGIWHLISGFGLAMWWSRTAEAKG
ncbi:MAG: bile acid:sodium symporter family protein [Bacteroidota bacterium]